MLFQDNVMGHTDPLNKHTVQMLNVASILLLSPLFHVKGSTHITDNLSIKFWY